MFTLRSPLLLPHWSVTHQTQSGRLRDGKILQKHITPHKSAIQGEDQLLFVQCVDVHCPDIAERFQPLSTPLFEEPLHHNGSHCKLLRASIVWNPISLSASPGSRHDLKVMPTLRLPCNLKTKSSLLIPLFHIRIVVILLYSKHAIVHKCKDFPRKVPNPKQWTNLQETNCWL